MNTKTTQATINNAAAKVAEAVANPAVVKALETASKHAESADKATRQAATLACANDFDALSGKARHDAILSLYMPQLGKESVKNTFSAAVAILCADKEVKTINRAKGANFGKAEVLPADEGAGAEDVVKTMSAIEAVAKLPSALLKEAATKIARPAMGAGRATGGGRKATKTTGAARAPFFEEVVAVFRDVALCSQFVQTMESAAKENPTLRAHIIALAKRLGDK